MSRVEFFTDEEQEQYGIDPQDGASMFTAFERYGDEHLGRYDRTECIRFILEALRHTFSFDVLQKLIQSSIQALALETYTYLDRTTKEERVNQFYLEIVDAVIEQFDVLSTYPNLLESLLEHFTGDNKQDFSVQMTALIDAEFYDAAVIFLSERYCDSVVEFLCDIENATHLFPHLDAIYRSVTVGTSTVSNADTNNDYAVAFCIVYCLASLDLEGEDERERVFLDFNAALVACNDDQKQRLASAILKMNSERRITFFESLVHVCDDGIFLNYLVDSVARDAPAKSKVLKASAFMCLNRLDACLSTLASATSASSTLTHLAFVLGAEMYAMQSLSSEAAQSCIKMSSAYRLPIEYWRRVFIVLDGLPLSEESEHYPDVLMVKLKACEKLSIESADEQIELCIQAMTQYYKRYLHCESHHEVIEKYRQGYHFAQLKLEILIFAQARRLQDPHHRVEKLTEWVGIFKTLIAIEIPYLWNETKPNDAYAELCVQLEAAIEERDALLVQSQTSPTAPPSSDDETESYFYPIASTSGAIPNAPSASDSDDGMSEVYFEDGLPTYDEATAEDHIPNPPRLTRSFSDPSLPIACALHAGMLVFTPEDFAARLAEARRSAREEAFEEVLVQLDGGPGGA